MESKAFYTNKPLNVLEEKVKTVGLSKISSDRVIMGGQLYQRFLFQKGNNRVVLCQLLNPRITHLTRALDPLVIISGEDKFVKDITRMTK